MSLLAETYGGKYDDAAVQLYFDKCTYELCKRGMHPSEAVQLLKQQVVQLSSPQPDLTSVKRQIEARLAKRAEAGLKDPRGAGTKAPSGGAGRGSPQAHVEANLPAIIVQTGKELDSRLSAGLQAAGISTTQVSGAAAGATIGVAFGPAGIAIGAAVGFFAGLVADKATSLIGALTKRSSQRDKIRAYNLRTLAVAMDVSGSGW